MQQLLNQLNSRDPAIRDAALREARALPPEELLQLLLFERRNRQFYVRLGYVMYIVFTFTAMMMGSHLHIPKGGCYGIYQAMVLLLANMFLSVYRGATDKARRQLSIVLAQAEDTRLITPMLRLQDALPLSDSTLLRQALTGLLPQLRADHATYWSKEDKTALLLPLKHPKHDKELALACLKALEQVGDASAIPAVKKLLDMAYMDDMVTIWRAAQECLLYLESNIGRFQQAETLLRASDTVTTRTDILLRPAQHTPDTTPVEQLLRPGE